MTDIETVYIAGPMAGYPEFNYPAFYAAEEVLEGCGLKVVNPARMDEYTDTEIAHSGDKADGSGVSPATRGTFLRRDFYFIIRDCQGIVLLPGWEKSTGANLELLLARTIGIDVFLLTYSDDTGLPILSEAPLLMPRWTPVWRHALDVANERLNAS